MKRLSIILCFLLYTVAISYSQENLSNWDYPVKPGSEKWKSFTTSTQKNKAIELLLANDSIQKRLVLSRELLDQVQTITELDQIFEDVKNNH